MLEYSLIKRHRPRFNIRLGRQVLSLSRHHPQRPVAPGPGDAGSERPGVEYFGPYAHAYAIRSTLDLLLRTFPIRTCTDALFKRQQAQGRPCLLYHIEKCTGPCIDAVTHEDTQGLVDGLAAFLRGDTDAVIERAPPKMYDASERQEYELAARYRDRLRDVERANERQEVVTDEREDFDLLATFGDDLETSVQVLHVRPGELVGRLGTIVDRVEDVTERGLIGSLLREVYGDQQPPREVLVQYLPDDAGGLGGMADGAARRPGNAPGPPAGGQATADGDRHGQRPGGFCPAPASPPVRPQRPGQGACAASRWRSTCPKPRCGSRRTTSPPSRAPTLLLRWWCSRTAFPRRSEYRRFKIKTVDGQDDFAAMEEVDRRRFTAYLREQRKSPAEQAKFSYPPSLVLIDGGPGQLGRAVKGAGGARPGDPCRRAGQTDGGGVPPGPTGTDPHPPG